MTCRWRRKTLFHIKLQHTASHDLLMGDGVVLYRLAVQLHALDMDAFRRLVGCTDYKVLAAIEVQGGFCEQRCANDILVLAGMEGIETEA